MNKKILSIALLSAGLAFSSAQAQMAKQKDVKMDDLLKHLNQLFQKGDDASKLELGKEALAMSQSKNENFVSLAARVYESLEQNEKAEAVNKTIIKKFPKGSKARSEAYEKIFGNENISADMAEKGYNTWLKQFPAASFDEKDRGIYDQAAATLAGLYFKENNTTKAQTYVNLLKSSINYPSYASRIATGLIKENKYDTALPILEDAYTNALEASKSTDPKIKSGGAARAYASLAPAYAQALIEKGNSEKAVNVLEEYMKSSPYAAGTPANVITLAKANAKQGKELDAFLSLENFVVKNGKNADVVKEMQPLYNKLNNNKANFDNYLTGIEAKAKEAMVSKYKSEMIKKEAPQFTLVNRDGKTVSLSDYKGKVVVLDFWATWCGPCVMSFPGMQAAVNKYKGDQEVEFLFIDTWQREENYKELVGEFMTKNNYSFHVLFDEMKDNTKATTTAYGVKGIPHKVVIDKEGFIRFESSGGSADVDKVVNEMETKIELARKG
ncbi:TlpA disulfide reductase family protein [Sphingobacterium faecale]|uniref:TlpA family protein disulfide reductase n=1 Tax=Sphingobacterium faecale TaxID=2803775 RepID=A0ABS1R0D6_9SPHI|nr:TlpA disulfide reductase family protein [Sphingobacterium faecale]MBL1408156.1 TlpA family protein disulfide reductase [Sphingobacterium faecale]